MVPGKRWRHILILATASWLLLALFFIPRIKKYELIFEKKSSTNPLYGYLNFHVNLDNDPATEFIYYRDNRNGQASYTVFHSNGETDDQYNFDGHRFRSALPFFEDLDGNGIKEIYLLIYRQDSIFLVGQEFMAKQPFMPERFITKHTLINDKVDAYCFIFGAADLTGDGQKEIIINIIAGFSLQPRALYAYDLATDSLWRSPLAGAPLGRGLITDLDEDGKPEIIISSAAFANYKDLNFPYHDNSAWVFIFDNKLKLKSKPLEFKIKPAHVQLAMYEVQGQNHILAVLGTTGLINSDSAIVLLNASGEIVRRSRFSTNGRKLLVMHDRLPYLFDTEDNRLFTLDSLLNMIEVFDFGDGLSVLYTADIDQDGEEEWIYNNSKTNTIAVYRHDLSHPATLTHTSSITYRPRGGLKYAEGYYGFEAALVDGSALIRYAKNPYYAYLWPAALLVYGMLLLLSYVLFKYRELKSIARDKKLLELQLASFKSQFDSHFTFNALNAIGSIIYKGKKEEAYDYFTKFSAMVRSSLDNSRKPIVTLAEEISFVKNYFELQKLRYKEKLMYEFLVDEQVNTEVIIPKMLIQVHVENAIKHGTSPKKLGGKIKVEVNQQGHDLLIQVEDNGIGREAAKARIYESPGKGLMMMHEFYAVFAKLYQIRIEEEIEDLVGVDNMAAGTRITIKIPDLYA